MRKLVILAATLLMVIGGDAKEARAYTTSFLVQLCRGELPKNLELPDTAQKVFCKLYFDGFIAGYFLGNAVQRESLDSEALEKTGLCMSAAEQDSIGELFSSYIRRNPNLGEELDISVVLFIMDEFKC